MTLSEKSKYPINIEACSAALAIDNITLYLILQYLFTNLQGYAPYPLYITLFIGGGILVFDLLKKLIAFQFGSDLLAGLSIVTAILLGEYLAGSLVVLMLSGGETLEKYAIKKASKMLEVLAKRAPTTAHRKNDEKIEDILNTIKYLIRGNTNNKPKVIKGFEIKK